jgi:Diadenosine tetraphosphate (Ap4A) hydrolase and other HIT family hydrolases
VTCIFCDIVAGHAPASFVYRDEHVAAFMSLQPTAAGECLIIPNTHIDHFTDIPDWLAEHIMRVAQHLGRRMRATFHMQRLGYLVHGYGVAHAHLILVPQQGPHHLISDRMARIENGEIVFDLSQLTIAARKTLDAHARLLSLDGLPEED